MFVDGGACATAQWPVQACCPYVACVWSDDANDGMSLLRVITGAPGRTGAKGLPGVRGVPGGIHTGLLTGNVTLVYNIYYIYIHTYTYITLY